MKTLFSTKYDIINIIYSIDPTYEKSHWYDLYLIWYYGREILPGHPNFEYTKGTHQLYLFAYLYEESYFQKTVRAVSWIQRSL